VTKYLPYFRLCDPLATREMTARDLVSHRGGLATSLLCCLFLAAAARAQTRPPRNYEDRGACPFECCTYRGWTVNADTVFYKSRTAGSAQVYRAKKGERVTGLTGVVVTLEPGRAVVRKATTLGDARRKVRVRPGDVIYLLHYSGEGVYKFWFRGRIYEDWPDVPYAAGGAGVPTGRGYVEKLSEPKTVWWVKVKNRRGQIGWSRQNRHFDDVDACGS
jgi:hypothetical protein